VPPEKLFRYRRIHTEENSYKILARTLDEVRTPMIFMAASDSFNDPLEYYFSSTIDFNGNVDEPISVLRKRFPNITNNTSNGAYLRQLVQADVIEKAKTAYKNGITCFQEECDTVLSWSHYADSHKGICIEFDTTKDSDLASIQKVEYKDRPPDGTSLIQSLVDQKVEENVDLILSLLDAIIITKAAFWQYEKEWRLAKTIESDEDRRLELNAEAVTAIYFGLKTPIEHKEQLVAETKGKLKYYDAVPNFDNYSLEFNKY